MVQIVELKLPSDRRVLMNNAMALTKKLLKAIGQVASYKTALEATPSVNLGGEIRTAQSLAVIIGRGDTSDVSQLFPEHSVANNVRIISYDQLVKLQKNVAEGLTLLAT